MKSKTIYLTQAAIIAAAYVVLTLPFAQFSFGQIQFRLAEALTVLAALTPAAIPGLFLGCLLTNTIYPSGLGLVDIIFGSLATLIAAFLTWRLSRRLAPAKTWWAAAITILPPVIVNALVVGFYLPFLLPDTQPSILVVATFMLSIALSESVVVYAIGWPLLLGLRKTRIKFYEE